MTNQIKAIVFDLDGVIVDSENAHLESLKKVLEPYGIKYTHEMHVKRFIGTSAGHVISTLFSEHKIKGKNPEKVSLERGEIYRKLVEKHHLKIVAGFMKFFKAVKIMNLKTAIATGSRKENMLASLKSAGLSPRMFDALAPKKHALENKPSPALFLEAAKKLRTNPKNCLVFEDSPAGVLGAKRAGMLCIALLTTTPKKKLEKAGADLIVRDFSDRRLNSLFYWFN